MKAYLVKMRESGIVIPKKRLFDRYRPAWNGELSLRETTDKQMHRLSRLAIFDREITVDKLFDAQILWIEGDRFALTGFERVNTPIGEVEYAQSWLIITNDVPESGIGTRK